MDFPWGSEYHFKFATNVGLITSDGPNGENIMAAEWTYLVNYSPAHILISVGPTKATGENISATKKFGVSIASTEQNWVSSIAGGSTGHKTDKIAALKEMGVKFTKGTKLGMLLVEGAALHAECEVIETIEMGHKTLYLGKVVDAHAFAHAPLVYHQNKYWKIDTPIEKPSDAERERMKIIVEKHVKEKN